MRSTLWAGMAFGIVMSVSLATPALSVLSDDDPCSFVYFDPQCSPSGWLSFILGDVLVAFLLSILVYEMGRRSSNKTRKTTEKIEKVLAEDEELRVQRLAFVRNNLKNNLESIIISVELMHMRLKAAKDPETARRQTILPMRSLNNAIRGAHNVTDIAVDVLDPVTVGDIFRLLNSLKSVKVEECTGTGFPHYEHIKASVDVFVEHLEEIKRADR